MKHLKPVNKHILIEPIKRESFIAYSENKYQEKGVVVSVSEDLKEIPATVGSVVYFDAWLACKYPGASEDEWYWLVKWEDVRGVEHVE